MAVEKEVYLMYDKEQGYFKNNISYGADGWVNNPFDATHYDHPITDRDITLAATMEVDYRMKRLWKNAECVKFKLTAVEDKL